MPDFKRKHGSVTYEIEDGTLSIGELICDRGHGKQVMNMFLSYVNLHLLSVTNIYLEAFTSYGVPVNSLVHFYSQFGFKPESRVMLAEDGMQYVKMRLFLDRNKGFYKSGVSI